MTTNLRSVHSSTSMMVCNEGTGGGGVERYKINVLGVTLLTGKREVTAER